MSTEHLQAALGYTFRDPELLRMALTHRSAVAEGAASESFERLEFLGDAVLDLAVADLLYGEYPGLAEGEMAKTRAAVVGEPPLAEVAEAMGVGQAVILGVGEERTGGRTKPSILSDTLEAVIGAVYVEAGFEAAAEVVLRLWASRVAARVDHPGKFDYKSRLQEVVAVSGGRPEYVASSAGPDHAKEFVVQVSVDGKVVGSGAGSSKKRAEQEAARLALEALEGA
ncbi:MAG: ribonuclease III [Acidimicrobiia bacterium]